MCLTKHTIWEVFPAADSFENFQKNFAPPIFIKENVPEVIKSSAITSEKLLLHSYYEYDFIDVALTHAIFDFEKALRIKWSEIHGKETKENLFELIDWFYSKKYFETQNNSLPHQLRGIRNGKVHDTTKSIGGVVFIRKIYETYYLINDLYEDPELRISRTKERYSLANAFYAFTKNGTILTYNSRSTIIFCIDPYFINNKSQPNTLSLFVCPIFDLSPYEKNEHYSPPFFTIKVTAWKFEENAFTAIDTLTGEPVLLTEIQDEVNFHRFKLWTEKLFSFDNFSVILFNVTEPTNGLFIKELSHFHQS